MPAQLARRYVAWLKRQVFAMIAVYAVVLGLALYLIAFKLPLFADFSYLLPQDVPAVRDLRKLEAQYREHSRELTLDEWQERPIRSVVLDNLARLTSTVQ